MNVKLAVVAPKSFREDSEYKNASAAVSYADEAARNGAQIVLFPEGYPGPCSGPLDSGNNLTKTPFEMMLKCANLNGIYISCGNLEESREVRGAYYLCHKLISPEGRLLADYRRCQPTPPALNGYLYNGRRHILPGEQLMVVNTELGRIGLIICSELWVPELCRIEMLMGAQIILAPIGGLHSRTRSQRYDKNGSIPKGSRMGIWHCIAQTRAAENMLYVAGTANVFFEESPWGSFAAGPEGLISDSEGEGISYVILDMDRLEYLRSRTWEEEDFEIPLEPGSNKPIPCQPGEHRDRRPELYTKLVEPQANAFDFKYFSRGGQFG